MFTHTVPAFSARAIRWARAPSRVHTAAASPKRVSFATRTASSASWTPITATAGPKISSRLIRIHGRGAAAHARPRPLLERRAVELEHAVALPRRDDRPHLRLRVVRRPEP